MRTSLVLATTLALAACGHTRGGPDAGDVVDAGEVTDFAQVPDFSPPGGVYTAAQTVVISCDTSGATIYYTTDGTDPTTASTRYTAPLSVSTYKVIKAMATAPGHLPSTVASASYAFDAPTPSTEAPSFSPAGGSYGSAQSVTISSVTTGAVLFYTVDGTSPTSASIHYTGPITVAQSQTLKAIATATGRSPSAARSASYVIGGTVSYLAACAALEAKSVALASSCDHTNPVYAEWASDMSSCAETQKEIDKGLIGYDASKGAACAAAIPNLSCDYLHGQSEAPAHCEAMLTGKVGANGTCYSSLDCQDGFCTSEVTATCPGTCKPFAGVGAACADDVLCGPDLGCLGGVCKALAHAGGACPCQAGLWCDLDLASDTGTCKARLAAGATCNVHGFNACAFGLVCAADTASCQALVGEGGGCTPPAQPGDTTACGDGYHCDSTTRKCVSDPTVGHACTADLSCLQAYCDDTTLPSAPTCKALVPDGGSCTAPEQCASLSCTNGTCDAPLSDLCLVP